MVDFPGKLSDFLKVGGVAAARGDVELMREILKERPKWIQHVGSHGRTLLWEAAHRGKLPMVKYLVRRKSDIDACGTQYTPYFVEISCYCIARYKKHHDVADFLLSKGAKQNIHTAAFLSDCDRILEFLKQDRKQVNAGHPQYTMARNSDGDQEFFLAPAPWATPLCYALRGGSVETVELLLKKRAKIKGFEKPLFIAAKKDYEKLKLLLERGADPSFLPEVFPDEGDVYELVSSYRGKGINVAKLNEEFVYLCRGDRGGNPDEVKRLLQLGANVNHQDAKGKTALHRAAKAGFVTTAQILIDAGARVDVADQKGETVLFDIARSTIKNVDNLKQCIRLIQQAGGDVSHKNRLGQTAVDVAAKAKRPEARELARLLKRK